MIPENEIFEKIKQRMRDRNVFEEQEYYDTTEEILDEFQDLGFITDDDDIEALRENLKKRWTEFRDEGF